MLSHDEQRVLPYTPEQLFDLVLGIEHYPDFLPWCIASRVTERREGWLKADVIVGYQVFRESFRSEVIFSRPDMIEVHYLKGPLRELENRWQFTPHKDGCRIDFHVSFAFKSKLFEKLMHQFFDRAVSKMVNAFEKRAKELYG